MVTAIYVIFTFQIAKETRKAAVAAQTSADFARTAAEASLRSALVAEAQLVVNFQVKIDRHSNGEVWFFFDSNVNVWIHAVTLDGSVLATETGPVTHHVVALRPTRNSTWSFPYFKHAGQGLSLEWVDPHYRNGDYGTFGFVEIEYSLNKESEIKAISVFFESKKGLGNSELRKVGIREKETTNPADASTPSQI